jgi:hypothetical protein
MSDLHSMPLRVSDLQLERLRLGELSPSEAEALRHRMSTDEGLRRRFERMREHEAAFSTSHPAAKWVPRIEAVVHSKPRASKTSSDFGGRFWEFVDAIRMGRPWAVGVLAVATLVLTALPIWFTPLNVVVDTTRIKGGGLFQKQIVNHPGIVLYRQIFDSAVLVQPGEGMRAGEAVQLEIAPGEYSFATVFSIDGRGEMSWHLPTDGKGLFRLPRKAVYRLPNAFLLDSAPGFERFYAVFSRDSAASHSLSKYGDMFRTAHQYPPEWLGQQLETVFYTQFFELRKVP